MTSVQIIESFEDEIKKEFDLRGFNRIEEGDNPMMQVVMDLDHSRRQKLYLIRDNSRTFASMASTEDEQVEFSEYQDRVEGGTETWYEESPKDTFAVVFHHTYIHYFGKLILNLINFKLTNGVTKSLSHSASYCEHSSPYRLVSSHFLKMNKLLVNLDIDGGPEKLHGQLVGCMDMIKQLGCDFDLDIAELAKLTLMYARETRVDNR